MTFLQWLPWCLVLGGLIAVGVFFVRKKSRPASDNDGPALNSKLEFAVEASQEGFWEATIEPGKPWRDPNVHMWYSRMFVTMLGYDPKDFGDTLRSWLEVLHPEDVGPTFDALERHIEGNAPFYETEYRLRVKGGSYRWFRARGTAQFDANGKVTRMGGALLDVTERKTAEQSLETTSQELRGLARRLEAVREDERKRVAREVHDQLGQGLTVLNIHLHWIRGRIDPKAVENQQKVQEMLNILQQVMQTVEKISSDLRPVILDDLGLVAALKWQTEEYQKTLGLECHFRTNCESCGFPSALSVSIFRILQEALTNVARHSGATEVWVSFLQQNNLLVLLVRDNGKGADPSKVEGVTAFGMLSMRERAMSWNGVLEVLGSRGLGTTIVVKIPFRGAEVANEREAKTA